MKKSILIVGIISFALTSCASGGWSCKKRYCETEKTNYELQKNNFTVVQECEVAVR